MAACILLAMRSSKPCLAQDEETIEVTLKLRTGGSLTGLAVDHNDDAIVVVRNRTPYAFAWDEVETGSAYRAKRDLLALRANAPARDHFDLALFALSRGRGDLARRQFALARRLDPALSARAKAALEDYRRNRQNEPLHQNPDAPLLPAHQPSNQADDSIADELGFWRLTRAQNAAQGTRASAEYREQVADVYEGFGESVREHVYRGLARIETPHFLIFTDWPERDRRRLASWTEAMYEALARRFGLAPDQPVFLAKCPVFCWQSADRFARFARLYDGHDATNAIGYTRSIPESGHVHVAVVRLGSGEAAMAQFAGTLVHEGSHAFCHRLYSNRLIPHWVNEGLAELTAEEILKDRYFAAEKADLLARQTVRYKWPITQLISRNGPIEVHQYPLAYSVIQYLNDQRPEGLARFVESLKNGRSVQLAVNEVFGMANLSKLEEGWREWIRDRDPFFSQSAPLWSDR